MNKPKSQNQRQNQNDYNYQKPNQTPQYNLVSAENYTTKNKKTFDIHERMRQFSLRVIDICYEMPRNDVNDVIRLQLIRSGTSVGANFEEADGSGSNRDFIFKATLARKEAKETKYWLKIIRDRILKDNNINNDVEEAQEIINILSAMIKKMKNNN